MTVLGLVVAVVLLVGLVPASAQERVDCPALAAEALAPLPSPPLPARVDDEGSSLTQMAAAIAAMQSGLAAQKGYTPGSVEVPRDRRERSDRDVKSTGGSAPRSYELQRQAWLERATDKRILLDRLQRECPSLPEGSTRTERKSPRDGAAPCPLGMYTSNTTGRCEPYTR
jgi:hypothetical protein